MPALKEIPHTLFDQGDSDRVVGLLKACYLKDSLAFLLSYMYRDYNGLLHKTQLGFSSIDLTVCRDYKGLFHKRQFGLSSVLQCTGTIMVYFIKHIYLTT